MPSVLQLKRDVANLLSKSNASTPVAKRDESILAAHREFVLERPWEWNYKTATISLVSGSGDLPADFSTKWEPKEVYVYDGTTKYTLKRVHLADIASYATTTTKGTNLVYALDFQNNLFKSNYQIGSITIVYQADPQDIALDGSDDADTLPYPDITPVALAAAGRAYQVMERDDDMYQLLLERSGRALRKAKLADRRVLHEEYPKNWMQGFDMGWNRRGR